MAQQSKTTSNAAASTITNLQEEQAKAATFHDFLGMKPADSSPARFPSKLSDPRFGDTSPSASVSAGRGPFSSASDLGSGQRQVQNHLEGIPFYPQRSDVTGTQISNRIMGSKRSNANAGLVGHDSIDSLHMMKMFRNGGGQSERLWKSNEDEPLLGMQPMKQSSGSLVLQPSATGRTDSVLTKWERSIPMNAGSRMPHSSHGGHLGSFVHHVSLNRFEPNAGLSMFAQAAADEGSRTGAKGFGVLSSINASASQPEQNSTGLLLSGGSKAGSHILDAESSNPPSRQMTSVTRQMTIFYAGQAHVFDEVHPNKADVIMALAGSNGGSWSTTSTSKSASQAINKTIASSSGLHSAANMPCSREILARASATAHGTGSADRISAPTGVAMKDARKLIQSVEPGVKEKH